MEISLQSHRYMYDINLYTLARADEVSRDVMVAGCYHICCCLRPLKLHVTIAVVQTGSYSFPVFMFGDFFPLFFLSTGILSDLRSLEAYYWVIYHFYSGKVWRRSILMKIHYSIG